MEIEYQTTKKDYTDFIKLYIGKSFQKSLGLVLLLIAIAMFFMAKSFHWTEFLIGTTLWAIVVFGLFYFIPLYRAYLILNRAIKKDPSGIGRKKLTVIDQGLLIESEDKTATWNWDSIVSVHSNELFVYIFLVDKRFCLFPKRIFSPRNDAINFMGLVQSNLKGIKRQPNFNFAFISKKPSYLLGLLCLIPGFGTLAGVLLIALGVATYRGKWFVIMGAAGMLFNILFCYSLFYSNIFGLQSRTAEDSQRQLNILLKDVEFYTQYKRRHLP